jgi:hypothetical protein
MRDTQVVLTHFRSRGLMSIGLNSDYRVDVSDLVSNAREWVFTSDQKKSPTRVDAR